MRRFAALFEALDASTATGDKVDALRATSRRRRRPTPPGPSISWPAASRARSCPPRCCAPPPARRPASTTGCSTSATRPWATWPRPSPMCCRHRPGAATSAWRTGSRQRVLPCAAWPPDEQAARLRQAFDELDSAERFLLVKLIGGGFRVGVSKLLVQRALALHAGVDPKLMAQRLMGWTDARASVVPRAGSSWCPIAPMPPPMPASPTPSSWRTRCRPSRPRWAGPCGDWLAEWKYDGIRAQLVRRAGEVLDLVARRRAGDRALPRDRGHCRAACPRARCSTARCWSGARAAARPSTGCSSASAARR
jgi:DNA ligase-1